MKDELDAGGVYRVKLPMDTFLVLLSLGVKRAIVLDSDHHDYSNQIGKEIEWRWLSRRATVRIA